MGEQLVGNLRLIQLEADRRAFLPGDVLCRKLGAGQISGGANFISTKAVPRPRLDFLLYLSTRC